MIKFKPILEFLNYSISNNGQVKNIKTNRILKPYAKKDKRLVVTLKFNPKIKKHKLIHRLVAIAFIPNPLNLPEVNHIDGNCQNNNDWNLEWCTGKQNAEHAKKNNLFCKGSKHGHSKLTEKNVKEILTINNNQTHTQLASKFGISRRMINHILNRKNWTHIM